jgi:hypothetical protein
MNRAGEFLLGVMVVLLITSFIFAVIHTDKEHDWIDQCVIQQWEPWRMSLIETRDYCAAKYRQTQ